MECESFDEEKGRCTYFEQLRGTGEDLPSACDPDTGECYVWEDNFDWFLAEPEDCDMLDLEN